MPKKKLPSLKKAPKTYENYAYALDVFERKNELFGQVIGESYFIFLEVTLKSFEDKSSLIEKRVYVGKENREIVQFITKRVSAEELTQNAKMKARELIVFPANPLTDLDRDSVENLKEPHTEEEKTWVLFFNEAGLPILRLLPALTKQNIRGIIEERNRSAFTSFFDIIRRTSIFDLGEMIAERIAIELGLGVDHITTTKKPTNYELKSYDPPEVKPYDSKGFDPARYPLWGREPKTIRCKNCLHWRGENWYCLTRKKYVHPRNWCRSNFRYRNEEPKFLEFIQKR